MRLEDQSDNFILSPNIECLLSLRYTQAQIELLNGQADSSKIIDALVELHRSNLLLMNKEKLYSLAVAGKLDSLNAYRKYAIKLTQLNFTSKQIFRLINGARALTRIELMIENWDALQEHKLQVKDLVTLFSGSVGPDGIKNVINYLPRLREKNCPLSFVRSVTQKTTGNILKTIFDNYSLLEHHECWKEIEHILLNTGLKELEFYIQALNSKLSPIDLEFNTKTTTVTHMNKSSFFLQQEKPADIYQSSDSMSIKNLLN